MFIVVGLPVFICIDPMFLFLKMFLPILQVFLFYSDSFYEKIPRIHVAEIQQTEKTWQLKSIDLRLVSLH